MKSIRNSDMTDIKDPRLVEYLRTYSASLSHLGEKIPKTEKRVRELDDPQLRMADSARRISRDTGFKYPTCFKYISTRRMGINERIYGDFLSRQKGFVNFYEEMCYHATESKNSPLTLEDFRAERARKTGFEFPHDYIRYLEDSRLFFHNPMGQNRKLPQKKFEYSKLEFHDPSELKMVDPAEYNPLSYTEHQKIFWDFVKDTLTEEQYEIILNRFVEGRTLLEAGKTFKLSREMIRQIEKKAIKKLKHPHRLKILRELI